MDFVDVSDELGHALTRASVLQSLDESFGSTSVDGGKMSKARTQAGGADKKEAWIKNTGCDIFNKPASGSGQMLKKNADAKVVDCILELIGRASSDHRTEKFFSQQLKGKALILENIKTVTEAARYKAKEMRSSKRQERVSNRKLKKLGIIATHPKAKLSADQGFALSLYELNVLHSSWKQYIRAVLKGCKNPMQFQARLMTAEMTGAEVVVLDARSCRGQIGLKGIVISATQNSFIICPRPALEWHQLSEPVMKRKSNSGLAKDEESIPPSKRPRHGTDDAKADTPLPFRLIKDDSVIGVFLPQQKGQTPPDAEPMMCVIHGKRFMPHATVNR